jgi:hypothetical protein
VFGWDIEYSLGIVGYVAIAGEQVLVADDELHVFTSSEGEWSEVQALAPSGGITAEYAVIAADEDVAVVADREHPGGGRAWVFRRLNGLWGEEQVLAPSRGLPNGGFGHAAAIQGSRIAVSALSDVFVFEDDGRGWTEQPVLTTPQLSAWSLAVGQDVVVVGDPGLPTGMGTVHIFTLGPTGWTPTQQVPGGSDGFGGSDNFGWSLALDGETLAVGAPTFHSCWCFEAACRGGGVGVFRRAGGAWLEQAALQGGGACYGRRLGQSVAVSGDTVLAGGPYFDSGCTPGEVHFFAIGPDADADGVPDVCDNCELANPDQSDCQQNGVGDACDVAGATSADCNDNAVPDECEARHDCDGNGVQDICDLAAGTALDCNMNSVPDSCDIADGGWVDLNENGIPDSCECTAFEECADGDGDGIRDDNCMWWACRSGLCAATPVTFADVGGPFGHCPPDGTADGHDRFHALNCFSNQGTAGQAGYPCEAAPPLAFNADAGGPFGSCAPDGVCDGHDAFHALHAFAGSTTCSCPPDGGTAPQSGGSPAGDRFRGR